LASASAKSIALRIANIKEVDLSVQFGLGLGVLFALALYRAQVKAVAVVGLFDPLQLPLDHRGP
jgi:hypothetical protein